MSTMKDVARLSGVSTATVSRVLTNNSKISPETRERVEQVIKQLNYVPNGHAQSLTSNRSQTICFTVARPAKEVFGIPFFDEVLMGISDQVEEIGYNLQLAISKSVDEQIEKCEKMYQQKKVDGFILSGVQYSDKEKLIQGLQSREIPFVLIGRNINYNLFSIHNDNVQDAYKTTQHLIEQQYEHIVLLNGDTSLGVVRDRTSGYQQAIQDHGLGSKKEIILSTDGSEESICNALKGLQDAGIPFDAILMAESIWAPSVVKFCHMNGLSIPDDIGLIGFNEWSLLEKMSPPVSCVEIRGSHLGVEAVKLLIELLDNPNKMEMGKNIILPSNLLIRESSKRIRD